MRFTPLSPRRLTLMPRCVPRGVMPPPSAIACITVIPGSIGYAPPFCTSPYTYTIGALCT